MRLENGRDLIELQVTGYEFPGTQTGEDANWLVLRCCKRMDGREREGAFPCFQTTDVARLMGLLAEYRDGVRSEFGWGGLEPNFSMHLQRIHQADRHLLTVFFFDERGGESYGEAKAFVKMIDNGEWEEWRLFWQSVLEAFPIR